MRILLVYPEPDIAPFYLQVPMGCLYLAAGLEKHNHIVKIYDQNVDNQKIETVIDQFSPDVVGISFTTGCRQSSFELIKKIGTTKMILVAGGIHPTYCPRECIEAGFDLVARGEVEDTFPILLENIYKNSEGLHLKAYPPAGYFLKSKGDYIDTGISPRSDIDKYFPARHLIPDYYHQRYSHGVLIGSRGCNFGCVFCASAHTGYVHRDPKIVTDELEYIVYREGHKSVFFADDIFTYHPNWVIELCQEIIQRKIHCRWATSSRSDIPPKYWHMFDWMYKAGCDVVSFGVESAHQEALKTSNKGIRIEKVVPVLNRARQAGINIRCNLIVGLPGSTYSDHLLSIELMELILPSQIVVSLNTPYPGTVMGSDPEKFGIHLKTSNWTQLLQSVYLDVEKFHETISYDNINTDEIFQFIQVLLERMSQHGYVSASQDINRLERPERVIKTFLDKVPLPAVRNNPGRKEHFIRADGKDWIL